jgi:hypothetical protein
VGLRDAERGGDLGLAPVEVVAQQHRPPGAAVERAERPRDERAGEDRLLVRRLLDAEILLAERQRLERAGRGGAVDDLGPAQPGRARELVHARLAPECGDELLSRGGDVALDLHGAARHSHRAAAIAQVPPDLAFDAAGEIGTRRGRPGRVEPVDGADERERSHLDEVLARLAEPDEPGRDGADVAQMALDQAPPLLAFPHAEILSPFANKTRA